MRSKAKYMAIVAIVVVAILAITLVSCGGSVTDETTKWLAGAKKATVTDTITLSDVKLNMNKGILSGDVITIKSLDLVATRVIEGDKLDLTIEVKNIKGLAFAKTIDRVLNVAGSLLDGINIKNIGDIDSIQIKLNYDPSQETVLTGEFHGYGLNAFITEMPEGDSNPKNDKFINIKADEVTGENHTRETTLINGIVDLLDNPIYGASKFDKDGKAESNVANIVALATLALKEYGEDKFIGADGNETQYDARSIVDMIFGSGSADDIAGIFEKVLSIAQLKMTASETQKVGGKNVYSKTEMSANVNVELESKTIDRISGNIGTILGALGVQLSDPVSALIPQVLQGDVTLEAKVKVESTYTNN